MVEAMNAAGIRTDHGGQLRPRAAPEGDAAAGVGGGACACGWGPPRGKVPSGLIRDSLV